MCPQVQTDGQTGIRNLVYPAPLSSRFPSPRVFPRVLASPYSFPLFLFLTLLPCRALSMVISTERRRLSFQPSFHPSATHHSPHHPPDASFLRIPYVRGKEFDSVVPARKTLLAGCVEEQEFLSQRALRRRCLASDDVELGTLDRYLSTLGNLAK